MIEQDGVSGRNKHIDVKFNFVKKLQQIFRTKYVHMVSTDMVADIFTKDLPDETYKRHADSILGSSVKSMNQACSKYIYYFQYCDMLLLQKQLQYIAKTCEYKNIYIIMSISTR